MIKRDSVLQGACDIMLFNQSVLQSKGLESVSIDQNFLESCEESSCARLA